MANKRTKKKLQSKPQNYIENINIDIDYDKLAKAIIKAQNQIDEDKAKEQERQKEERLVEWQKNLNYTNYPTSEKWCKRIWHSIKNTICVFWSMCTLKKEKIDEDKITFGLLQLAGSSIFSFISFLLYIITFAIIAFLISDSMNDNILANAQPFFAVYAILTLLFASIFRIAAFEIEKIKSKDYLISIISVTTSIVAMIVAIIALFQGGGCNCVK